MHHIICDGWSMAVLLRELEYLYTAACEGITGDRLVHQLPWPEMQYRQYSQELARIATGMDAHAEQARDASLRYWSDQLCEAPVSLDLPSDLHTVDRQFPLAGTLRSFRFTAEQSERIATWTRQQGVTLASVMLAAWACMLGRYCAQDDVVLGLPVSGRASPEWFNLVGLCINTVVLRLQTDAGTTFRDVAQQAQIRLLEASEHGQIPFDDVVRALAPTKRERNHTSALYNVLFAMQDGSMFAWKLPGLGVTELEVDTRTSMEDLALECWREDGVISGRITYRTELFSALFIEGMIQHFEIFLLGAIASSDVPVARVPLLSNSERDMLLKRYNQTQLPVNHDVLVSDLIVAQAVQRPQAPAVIASDSSGTVELSFGELFTRAAELASHLRSEGVTLDIPVAVLLDRSIAWVVAEVAVVLAGGYYVAIDPGQPPERIRAILTEAQPLAVLTSPTLFAALGSSILPASDSFGHTGSQYASRMIYLDPTSGVVVRVSEGSTFISGVSQSPATVDQGGFASSRTASPGVSTPAAASMGRSGRAVGRSVWDMARPTHENLAYCVFTSGSTGVPKGVCVPHGSLLNFVTWYREAFELTANDRFTCMAGLGFDVAVSEIWPTLASGGCVYLVDELTSYDAERLQKFLLANQITLAYIPTPLCERLLTLSWPLVAPLRLVVTGGDRLHSFTPPGVPFSLYNVYGPSETTVWSSWEPVPSEAEGRALGLVAPTIGWPINNTQLYVLDQYLQLVPIGVPGELYIAGLGLARGYLNREAFTRERFIPNPFYRPGLDHGQSSFTSPLMYKTGDRVRRLRTGQLEFIGRIDTQVKIAGFRIEPGEIEAALMAHPAVRTAVVVPVERQDRLDGVSSTEKELLAFAEVAHTRDERPTETELMNVLVRRVPSYMIPTHLWVLDEFPHNLNGKVDRAALLHMWKDGQSSSLALPLPSPSLVPPRENSFTPQAGMQTELPPQSTSATWDRAGARDVVDTVPLPQRERRIVSQPRPVQSATARQYLAGAVPTESTPSNSAAWQVLQHLWTDAVGSEERPVAADEHFLEAGGVSLDMPQVLAMIKKVWGVEIPFGVFYESPVFGTLWDFICERPDQEWIEQQAKYVLDQVQKAAGSSR